MLLLLLLLLLLLMLLMLLLLMLLMLLLLLLLLLLLFVALPRGAGVLVGVLVGQLHEGLGLRVQVEPVDDRLLGVGGLLRKVSSLLNHSQK